MPRIKRTARKQPMEDVVYEEPPQDHRLGKYFKTLDDLNGYMLTFSDHKEIPPRYLEISLIASQNFNSLAKILDDQGLMYFVEIRDRYYPDLVGIAYSTLSIVFNEENKEEFMFKFKFFKKEYELDCHTLASIWNLQYLGSLFDGKHALESWGPHIKQHAYHLFNIQRQSRKKLSCSVFNTEMKVLHYILNYVLMPRAHGHGHVTDDDHFIMYAMVNEVTINWNYFIVQHMLRFKKGQSSIGFGIDLSEEVSKTLVNSSVIDIRTLHHMGRAMEDQGQEEEAPQAHQAPQAPQASHEPQVGPSQQSSMLDLMHVLQRIEQTQDRMDRQFQSVDRRLHRIELYLEIEEDEDEDQD
ncbi:hypothetical protein PIB30_074362 [Stylosanthes scabra]|uniref:Uncharacterized protein n=1 Tax=Stylosanthes scabra TaxID=79078 RepID=A0ABU6XPN4_9FABA|nr:hypothetical protein [Stylosanthes scabra]